MTSPMSSTSMPLALPNSCRVAGSMKHSMPLQRSISASAASSRARLMKSKRGVPISSSSRSSRSRSMSTGALTPLVNSMMASPRTSSGSSAASEDTIWAMRSSRLVRAEAGVVAVARSSTAARIVIITPRARAPLSSRADGNISDLRGR